MAGGSLHRQTNPLGLVHAIAHALRHRTAPELIGQRLVLDGFASLEPRGRMLWNEPEARLVSPSDEQLMGSTLAKRGGLLLVLELPLAWLPAADPRASFRLLRELGFVGETAEDNEDLRELDGGDGSDLLEELLVELTSGDAYALLFVQPRPDPVPRPRTTEAPLPPDYFPRVFEVVDACVTNYSWLWAWKYMWW